MISFAHSNFFRKSLELNVARRVFIVPVQSIWRHALCCVLIYTRELISQHRKWSIRTFTAVKQRKLIEFASSTNTLHTNRRNFRQQVRARARCSPPSVLPAVSILLPCRQLFAPRNVSPRQAWAVAAAPSINASSSIAAAAAAARIWSH